MTSPERLQQYKQKIASLQASRSPSVSNDEHRPISHRREVVNEVRPSSSFYQTSDAQNTIFLPSPDSSSLKALEHNNASDFDRTYKQSAADSTFMPKSRIDTRSSNAEMDAMAITIEELTLENELFRKKSSAFNELQEQVVTLKQLNRDLERRLSASKEETEKLRINIDHLRSLNNEARKNEASWEVERTKMNSLLETAAESDKSHMEEIAALKRINQELQNNAVEHQRLETKWKSELHASQMEHTQRIEEMRKEFLGAQLEHAQQIESMRKEFAAILEKEKTELGLMHITQLEAVASQNKAEGERYQSDLQRKADQVEKLLQQAQKLRAERDYAVQTKEALEKDMLVLERQIPILRKQMDQLSATNSSIGKQNVRLTYELPQKIQALRKEYSQQIASLESEVKAALSSRDRFTRSMERRLAKRDAEIHNLRNVWAALLTSHPDLDRASEAAISELKKLRRDNSALQHELEQAREENSALAVMVAISHLKLMLAHWRKPMYTAKLQGRLKNAAEIEQILELEDLAKDLDAEERETIQHRLKYLQEKRKSPIAGNMEYLRYQPGTVSPPTSRGSESYRERLSSPGATSAHSLVTTPRIRHEFSPAAAASTPTNPSSRAAVLSRASTEMVSPGGYVGGYRDYTYQRVNNTPPDSNGRGVSTGFVRQSQYDSAESVGSTYLHSRRSGGFSFDYDANEGGTFML